MNDTRPVGVEEYKGGAYLTSNSDSSLPWKRSFPLAGKAIFKAPIFEVLVDKWPRLWTSSNQVYKMRVSYSTQNMGLHSKTERQAIKETYDQLFFYGRKRNSYFSRKRQATRLFLSSLLCFWTNIISRRESNIHHKAEVIWYQAKSYNPAYKLKTFGYNLNSVKLKLN